MAVKILPFTVEARIPDNHDETAELSDTLGVPPSPDTVETGKGISWLGMEGNK